MVWESSAVAQSVPLSRKLVAEFIGTYALVFAGTAAIVVHREGSLAHEGVALTFGLVVFAMISAIGDVSGAHINPAVTLAFAAARRFPSRWIMPYIASQCLGAISASVTVRLLFPQDDRLGATIPAGTLTQSWVLELFY